MKLPKNTKTILVMTGPGFYDQPDFIAALRGRGYTVKTASVSYATIGQVIPGFLDADLVVMRGAFTPTADEKILARQLALRLQASFEAFGKRLLLPNPPKILAIGRGALIYSMSAFLPIEARHFELEWELAFADTGPWIKVDYENSEFFAHVQNRVAPTFESTEKITWRPLLKSESQTVAWTHRDSSIIAFVDLLACAERNQLLGFGYEDLLKVKTHVEIFEEITRL